jgi:hypothetical protein
VPLLVASATAVLALGPQLTVLGTRTGVPLPWALLRGLPGFEHVLVTRFPLVTGGLLGAALAFALDDALVRAGDCPRRRRGALLAAAFVLVPLIPAALPGAKAEPVPPIFTSTSAALSCPGGSLLVLPFPLADATGPMRWQAASGLAFAMPGGYFIGPDPNGRVYVNGPPTRTGALFAEVARDGRVRPVTPQLSQDLAADLVRWRTCAVLLGPARHHDELRSQATALLGREPQAVGGVLLWPVAPPG